MIELKASTRRGQDVIAMGESCNAHYLNELYSSWSVDKQRAYEWCAGQYSNDPYSHHWRVGNANTFSFTATWLTVVNGEPCRRVETNSNSYLVYLNR